MLAPAIPHWKIDGTRLGPFYIGMRLAELRAVSKRHHFRVRPTKWYVEGQTNRGYSVSYGKALLIKGFFDHDRIWWIQVYDPRFSTLKGIHVGSTLRDAVRAYGTGDVDGGDNVVSLSFDKVLTSIDFVLASDGDWNFPGRVTPNNLPKNTPHIFSVTIHKAMNW